MNTKQNITMLPSQRSLQRGRRSHVDRRESMTAKRFSDSSEAVLLGLVTRAKLTKKVTHVGKHF